MKKILKLTMAFMVILLFSSLFYNVLLNWKVSKQEKDFKSKVIELEDDLESVEKFVDQDKYVFFTVDMNSGRLPDGIVENQYKDSEPQCRIEVDENGKFKLSTFKAEFKKESKLVYNISNGIWMLYECDKGYVLIDIIRGFSGEKAPEGNILLTKFKITTIDDYALRIKYDDKTTVVKVGESLIDEIIIKMNGEIAKFSFEIKNFGMMKKSETKFKAW